MTRSLSSQSLFKAGYVKLDADDVRVINSNDRISQKLEALRKVPFDQEAVVEEDEAYMDEAENDETAAAERDGESDAQLVESSLNENATKLIEQANSRADHCRCTGAGRADHRRCTGEEPGRRGYGTAAGPATGVYAGIQRRKSESGAGDAGKNGRAFRKGNGHGTGVSG